jgi:hypothetical protein
MHLTPSDPDIATLIRKIDSQRLDLQPNFQRGEVWSKIKKQRLIDSILRGWHIPPVHIVQVPDSDRQEVLDGQQRLAAIRDFIRNEFPINGSQEPLDDDILNLDGKFWHELPSTITSRVEDFTLRVLTISDFQPGEPGELFYRLNQPTNLTSAEQRNAYFGEARGQIKELVEQMEDLGFSKNTLGFSNSRMAYDDVIAKCLISIELGTISKKVTANVVTTRYREKTGFDNGQLMQITSNLNALMDGLNERNGRTRLNKATLYSWILFINQLRKTKGSSKNLLIEFFDKFESYKDDGEHRPANWLGELLGDKSYPLIEIYLDRASSRVADISSVRVRNLVLWMAYISCNPDESTHAPNYNAIVNFLKNTSETEIYLLADSAILSLYHTEDWIDQL